MATAAAPNSVSVRPPAGPQQYLPAQLESNTVATQFVQQYYHVLSNWPENLHRFYTDASALTHSVVGGESVRIHTQRGIHEKVMGLGLQGAVPQILSVDSQTSLGGGVVVHTTGYLTLKGKKTRLFAQVFFLAQQEKGYYVLNDLFCWLQREDSTKASPLPPLEPNKEPADVETTKLIPEIIKQHGEKKPVIVSNSNVAPVPPAQPPAAPKPVPSTQATQARVEDPDQDLIPENLEPGAQMTYAQRLKMAAAKSGAKMEAMAKLGGGDIMTEPPSTSLTSEEGESVEPGRAPLHEANMQRIEHIDTCSVFVRNLPPNITDELLVQEFSKFGPIEGNTKGISLKKSKNVNPYAFVQFESAHSVANAIASKVEIEGLTLEIAEKKPTIISKSKTRSSNVGRGRGDVSGSSNGRGNSNYSGGHHRMGRAPGGGGDARGGNGRQGSGRQGRPDSSDRRGRGSGRVHPGRGSGASSGRAHS